MEFFQTEEPEIEKPIIIAAMQDMGNVGSIVVNFINKSLNSRKFRTAKSQFPTYVIDKGGYIDVPLENWELLGNPSNYPNSLKITKQTVSLPIYPSLKKREQKLIIENLKKFI